MRVAMVILEYAPILGGAQLQLAQVAPRLRARGIDVHVLTRRVNALPAREEIDGVPVRRLPAPGGKLTASLAFTASCAMHLAALRPDVIHAYSLFSPSTAALLVRAVSGVPVVVKVLRGGEGGEIERLERKPLARPRIDRIVRHVDRFITISEEIDASLARVGVPGARRVAIPNGVDVERFRPAGPEERRALRARLGLLGAPAVVWCGRLVPEKNVAGLLDVWRAVRMQHPESQLLVVGSGPEEAALRRVAGDGVVFLGEQSDVSSVLRAADLFVLPSRTEGLSNALLEAMAAGLPVVATRAGAAEEIVRDGAMGRLVPIGDDDALGRALCELLGDPDRARLGAHARETVVARHALDKVVERLVALYGELAGQRRSVRAGLARSPGRSGA
jgi:glycosyltransferase involved in cell wall biosynthesis